MHCFGSINDKIDQETAINFIKTSDTNFLTVYTQGDLSKITNIDDFPIGYAGLTYKDIKDAISEEKHTMLVNTNHALTVEEAVKRAEIGSRYSKSNIIKLEVLNPEFTKPINEEVIKAAEILLDKGYTILPLVNANIEDIKLLEKMGCSAIRILLSNIGSEKGLVYPDKFKEICSTIKIPVVAEGGIRAPEDGYNSMVLGASAVLVNRSLFCYQDPLFFLEALKESIKAGRKTFLCNKQRIT